MGAALVAHGFLTPVASDAAVFEDSTSAVFILTYRRRRSMREDTLAEAMPSGATPGTGHMAGTAGVAAAGAPRGVAGPDTGSASPSALPGAHPGAQKSRLVSSADLFAASSADSRGSLDPHAASPASLTLNMSAGGSVGGRAIRALMSTSATGAADTIMEHDDMTEDADAVAPSSMDADALGRDAQEDAAPTAGQDESRGISINTPRRAPPVRTASDDGEGDGDGYASDGALDRARQTDAPGRAHTGERPLRTAKSAHVLQGPSTPGAQSVSTPAAARGSAAAAASTPTPGPFASPLDKLTEARRALVARRLEMETRLVKEGWMVKQGHKFRTWKRRWFVLQGYELSYYRKAPHPSTGLLGVEPAGSVDVREFTLEEASIKRSACAMRLVAKRTVDNELLMFSESEGEFVAWVKALSTTMRAWEELSREDMALQATTSSMPTAGVTFLGK